LTYEQLSNTVTSLVLGYTLSTSITGMTAAENALLDAATNAVDNQRVVFAIGGLTFAN
jgi:hypothetical protein